MVVYIAEDPTLPLVNISLLAAHGRLPRARGQGGPGRPHRVADPPRRHDDPDRRAARREARLPGRQRLHQRSARPAGRASLNSLRDNLDESLRLFVEMLKQPRFQEDRLRLAKEQALQEMKKRNDDAEDIEQREWNVLLYGEQHFSNRFATAASIRVHHARRPRGLPPALLPPREHDRGRLRRLLARGDDPEAGGGVRELAGRRSRRCRPCPSEIADRGPRPLPHREGHQPGARLHRPARRCAATARTSTRSR